MKHDLELGSDEGDFSVVLVLWFMDVYLIYLFIYLLHFFFYNPNLNPNQATFLQYQHKHSTK